VVAGYLGSLGPRGRTACRSPRHLLWSDGGPSRDCRASSMVRPRICGYSNTRFPWARLRRSAIERRLLGHPRRCGSSPPTIVIPVVVGSNPIRHPIHFRRSAVWRVPFHATCYGLPPGIPPPSRVEEATEDPTRSTGQLARTNPA